jgi:hypothetical protein
MKIEKLSGISFGVKRSVFWLLAVQLLTAGASGCSKMFAVDKDPSPSAFG